MSSQSSSDSANKKRKIDEAAKTDIPADDGPAAEPAAESAAEPAVAEEESPHSLCAPGTPWVLVPTCEEGGPASVYFNETGEISDSLASLLKRTRAPNAKALHNVHLTGVFDSLFVGNKHSTGDERTYIFKDIVADFGMKADDVEAMCAANKDKWVRMEPGEYNKYLVDNDFPAVRHVPMDGWC